MRSKNLPLLASDNTGRKAAIVLVILLTSFVLLQCLIPLATAIQIGADEGFEFAKATLCVKGYRLYTDVWNDQPPLHTFLVTQILKHISASVLGPRLLTTGFTMVLLTSVFLMSLRISGIWVAALTVVLIVVSPGFMELSSSCMLEIPGLAMAVGSLSTMARALAFIHQLGIGISNVIPTTGLHETRFAGPNVGRIRESGRFARWRITPAPEDLLASPRTNQYRAIGARKVFGPRLWAVSR